MTKAHHIRTMPEVGIILYPGAQAAAVHGLTDILVLADGLATKGSSPRRRLRVTHWWAHPGEGDIECIYDSSPSLAPRPTVLVLPPTLVQLGEPAASASLAGWLRARHAEGVTLLSICSGAYILAATGLLDGRAASTHHSVADRLAADFPAVRVDVDQRIIDLGDIVTAGGFMAWIDVALMLVERSLGTAIRDATAAFLSVDPARERRAYAAGAMPVRLAGDAAMAKVLEWIHIRDGSRLALADLAGRAG